MLFWASLAHFIAFELPWSILFFGHPRPISFPWASLAHSNPSFLWTFAKSFGFPRPKLPYPLLSGFIGFSTNPYLLNSFLWAPLTHSYLLSISIMPMDLLLLSLGFFGLLAFFKVLLLFYRPMVHYSYHLV